MAPETKARAKKKLGTLQVGIGYPDKPRDYSALEIRRDDALGNTDRASLFEYRRNLAKLGKPVAEATGETALAGDLIDWFAEEARRAYGRIVPARFGNVAQLVIKEPVGPVAAFKTAIVVNRLPKTRSGKILRGTMQKIADGVPWKMPATIDDPAILDEIGEALRARGYGSLPM